MSNGTTDAGKLEQHMQTYYNYLLLFLCFIKLYAGAPLAEIEGHS